MILLQRRALFLIFLLFTSIIAGFADERPPIDVMMAVDVSNSMAQEITAVKDYINNDLLENYVQIGDYLLIIMFYATTEVPVSMPINSAEDLEKAKQIVSGFKANHPWTDIGNALDVLELEMQAYAGDNRDKFLIIITDGEQTAPWSKYTQPGGKVNHELLQNAYTEIAKQGWKVQFLVSGGSSMIKEMAQKMSGTYTEISENPTEKELSESIQEPGGIVKITGQPQTITVTGGGQAVLPLTLSSSGFTKDQEITVDDIIFYSGKAGELHLLKNRFHFSVEPDQTMQTEIPLQLPADLAVGDYVGDLTFSFSSQAIFTPGRIEARLHVNGFLENYPWIIAVAVLVLAALVVLFILLLNKRAKARTIVFRLLVEEEPLKEGKDTFSLKIGHQLYMNESLDMLSLTSQKSPRSIGRLTGQEGAIKLEVLKEDQLPGVKKIKGNILGERLEVMSSSGRKLHITLRK
jgi:Mg-chelatase subunit ChlD